MDLTDIEALEARFNGELQACADDRALTALHDAYLSRKRGHIGEIMRQLPQVDPSVRGAVGQRANALKRRVEEAIEKRRAELAEAAQQAIVDLVDVTLPGIRPRRGFIHPISQTRREICRIFMQMGYSIEDGPELDTEYYNFEAANIPRDHPARDAQDSFYVTDDLLLRTHTTPVQIHAMERRKPPLRIIAPGRVFRRDATDATHTPMFFQVEGLVVGKGISFAHLRGTLQTFAHMMFGPDVKLRLRPSYFPFVEPGAEVDISCFLCKGNGCRVCKDSGWIEILGAGMVHPALFDRVGYDRKEVTGFAFGMGIDRITLLKHGIEDTRLFFENDYRFLSQFRS
ncbi:MAG: phenylalanine--tRNA ligase subunit alpha [Acidobacteria bacterium]|nr:phenylalanine--tRNA ligase subunit alpha [Acidobacteriota bacterium]